MNEKKILIFEDEWNTIKVFTTDYYSIFYR